MTTRLIRKAQLLRVEIGRVLSRDFPQFSGLESKLPDEVLDRFLHYVTLCPSVPFLEYCDTALAQRSPVVAEYRITNLLAVLPDPDSIADGIRERSAVISLIVSVVNEMAAKVMLSLFDDPWNSGVRSWVRGATLLAQHLPHLWNGLEAKERLMIYLALAGAQGNMNPLIKLCRERGVLSSDFLKAYFENASAPLSSGVL